MKRRSCAGQKTGRMPESRRRSRLVDARRPVPVMVRCEWQAPRQARAGVAALSVSRFVIVARPAARSGRERILFECPHRTSCRSPSPTGQRNEIAPDVCRWFVRSSPRAVSRVGGRREKAASMVASLACRGGVRTFGAACDWRMSRACLLGALAAAPGSVAMLAHRLPVHP
jgi:hypothetical protein